jgi:hypothetical protein
MDNNELTEEQQKQLENELAEARQQRQRVLRQIQAEQELRRDRPQREAAEMVAHAKRLKDNQHDLQIRNVFRRIDAGLTSSPP